MRVIAVRPAQECRYDVVSLGEVMLRLDPGETRIRTARSFQVWEGGGEYNVARALSRVFGVRAAVVTALVDNEIGRLVESLILQGGVDTSMIRWQGFDGVGRRARNGVNFTERGFGIRPPLGVSDRGHTAIAQLQAGDVDWDGLFGSAGSRWFHTGGVFAGLSDTSPGLAKEAMMAARRHGTVVSYDLNYRPSLWADRGGLERAIAVNRELVEHVDVLIGNEGHFAGVLGIGADNRASACDSAAVRLQLAKEFPAVSVVGATMRRTLSASRHDWSAASWNGTGDVVRAVHRTELAILDRVGGGDGFAAGFIYGLLESGDLQLATDYGAAHGALTMTTPGDWSMAGFSDVQQAAAGAILDAQR